MGIGQTVRTTCGICEAGCGMLAHLDNNGTVIKVEGDLNCPINQGRLCTKGKASLEYLYHPDRLKQPLRRKGEKGEGKWQQIPWDEALGTIAESFARAKNESGPESVVFMRGGTRGIVSDYLTRFANAFGSPNISSMAPVCYVPYLRASALTHGFLPYLDHDCQPRCIISWGSNIRETSIGRYHDVLHALDNGASLIVIDPYSIGLTQRADLWLKVRPGSDLALAMGMINVIVNEDLYDRSFVDKWTVGFDELKSHIQDYPPEKVSQITWVDAESIKKAARLYATNKPAYIQWGNGIEHNINSFQVSRAIAIMKAITGNLEVPGGEVKYMPLPTQHRGAHEFSLVNAIPQDVRAKRISAGDGLLPNVFYALPQTIIKSILEKDPYPIRMAYAMAGNNILSFSNTQETYKAFMKLDFMVVADMFMTPTTALADIILPVASYLEFDGIKEGIDYPIAQVQQKVAQIGECRSDYQILGGLAKKLGMSQYFWETEEECLDFLLKPAGMTFADFRSKEVIYAAKIYRSYEKEGFETPSGKVELYSNQLKEWGFDPLPVYLEPPESPYSDPELAKEYPLILTSIKPEPYRHTEGKQIPSLRGSHPDPIITIHSQTAAGLGIKEGDWVFIATKRGKIKQKAKLSDSIDPRVVIVDYAWWFPEKGASSLHGYAESNINMLTDNKQPYGREMGTANLRGLLCKVYKANV